MTELAELVTLLTEYQIIKKFKFLIFKNGGHVGSAYKKSLSLFNCKVSTGMDN